MVKEIVALFILQRLIGKERAEKVSKRFGKYILKSAGVIFFLIAIAHGLRLAFRIEAGVGDWNVPFWISFIVVIIASIFAVSLWKVDS